MMDNKAAFIERWIPQGAVAERITKDAERLRRQLSEQAYTDRADGADERFAYTAQCHWAHLDMHRELINGQMVLREMIGRLIGAVEALEARPEFKDAGVYKQGNAYSPGEGVTWDGCYWICQTETTSKPPSPHWRMAVKKGRDAPR